MSTSIDCFQKFANRLSTCVLKFEKERTPHTFRKSNKLFVLQGFLGKKKMFTDQISRFFPKMCFAFFFSRVKFANGQFFYPIGINVFFRKPSTWCLCDRRTSLDISGAVKLVVLSQPGVRENPTPILNSALMKGEVICLIRCSLATPEPNTDSARQNELLNMAQFPKVEKFFQQQFKIQKSIRALVETLIAAPK